MDDLMSLSSACLLARVSYQVGRDRLLAGKWPGLRRDGRWMVDARKLRAMLGRPSPESAEPAESATAA